jgi:homoaconitate hydratase
MTEGPTDRPLRAGDFISVKPRHVMTHDNTAPVMKKFSELGATRIMHPEQPVFILDHDIQNRSPENLAKYRSIEEFACEQGVDFHPAGTGIGHQVMIEQQYVLPGSFVVASDSHANMYGGMGAIGTPVVRTDAAAIWAAGTFWWQIPRTIQVRLEGKLKKDVAGKDVILALCSLYNSGEVLNAAIEFSGTGVATLSLAERLCIANMTTEWGALTGWFEADETTLDYIRRRRSTLAALGTERVTDEQLQRWKDDRLRPDADALYAGSIGLDLSLVTPQISGPDSVQVASSLSRMQEKKIKIDKAYLVSCVNAREQDIAEAAGVLEGKRIAEGVELYVAAASRAVQEASEASGAWGILMAAGAKALPPGCGPCIGLGTGLLEAGEVGISATNRNFKGRMGSRDAKCFLAGPSVVAASAVAGHIRGPALVEELELPYRFETQPASGPRDQRVEILPGFPKRVSGRLLLLREDNINTDGIYGKDYTYRDDMTRSMMAQVIFENYDPALSGMAREGDIILAGRNFGTGSSREQAVTALQAKGIILVIAGSCSQTYLRNAFNNGFPCIECPALLDRVRQDAKAGKTTVFDDDAEVDFAAGTISFRKEIYSFPPLGVVPQGLIVTGGVENQVRQRLGLD